MRSKPRLIAAIALAALCAPGTLLRTDLPDTMSPPEAITLTTVAGASATGTPGWQVEGVWQYDTESLNFGGFSALLTIGPNRLRAFSDRGVRFTFTEPDRLGEVEDYRVVSQQLVDSRYAFDLWDIEAATRHPGTREYWLAFENVHAIQRYSVASVPEAVVILDGQVDWPRNAGAEALLRLQDGRFLLFPEGRSEALLYPSDPVEGAQPVSISYTNPAPSFVISDISQLPDGRIMLLMRALAWAYPPFSSLIAIADPPRGNTTAIAPEVALRFEGSGIPRENYEAMAVRAQSDGTIVVWIMADNNKSVMQRNLLVKLRLDPTVAATP